MWCIILAASLKILQWGIPYPVQGTDTASTIISSRYTMSDLPLVLACTSWYRPSHPREVTINVKRPYTIILSIRGSKIASDNPDTYSNINSCVLVFNTGEERKSAWQARKHYREAVMYACHCANCGFPCFHYPSLVWDLFLYLSASCACSALTYIHIRQLSDAIREALNFKKNSQILLHHIISQSPYVVTQL